MRENEIPNDERVMIEYNEFFDKVVPTIAGRFEIIYPYVYIVDGTW